MADNTLESNKFYKYLRAEHEDKLAAWSEPEWVVCIPQDSALTDYDLTDVRAAGHALKLHKPTETGCEYTSELYGDSLIYLITGDEPRVIVSQTEEDEKLVVSVVSVINEYLISVKEKVIHILLVEDVLQNAAAEDHLWLSKLQTIFLSSSSQAEKFLSSFRAHQPLLKQLQNRLSDALNEITFQSDIDEIQCTLHDIILYFWDSFIKTHTSLLLTNSTFQDLLFRALDFYVGTKSHELLLCLVQKRCQSVDQMTKNRLSELRTAQLSPHHVGVSSHYYTPLPAAVVELASLATVESAIGRLHCISATLDLIQAQAKEARLNLHQYHNKDEEPILEISTSELVGLLTTVIIEAQCSDLVSNIYFMTHFVFSVTDDQDSLWQSLGFLRKSLEQIMKLDLKNLSKIASPVRKELSLQDLMQVSVDMESRFEKHQESQSMCDITALDLQLQQVTQRIQLSTQALSETQLSSRNSSGRMSDRGITSSPVQGKAHSFVEFLSSIPSTIRASFHRKQSQKKLSIASSVHSELPDSIKSQLKIGSDS